MRRLVSIAISVCIILNGIIVYQLNAGSIEVDDAITIANDQILVDFGVPDYYSHTHINEQVYSQYGVLAYGSPHGTYKDFEYRYVGYTQNGGEFPNPAYNYDSNTGTMLDYKNWVVDPWGDSNVMVAYPKLKVGNFNANRPAYRDNFIAGMLSSPNHGPRFANDPSIPWEDYYHIVVPPTEYAHGLAWVWHIDGAGTVWYITVTLTMHSMVPAILSTPVTPSTPPSTPTTPTGDVVIGSNTPGNEIFDTVQGIPSGEDIYTRIATDSYILDYHFVERSGSRTYTATITGEYDNGDGTTTPFTERETVRRSYSYYDVEWYYVYEIDSGTVYNYVLSGNGSNNNAPNNSTSSSTSTTTPSELTMTPSSYDIRATHSSGGIIDSPSSESRDVGVVARGYDFAGEARRMIDSYSTRDGYIEISGSDNQTIRHNSIKPTPPKTDRELYVTGQIESTLANQANTSTTATVTYVIANEHNSNVPNTTQVNLTGNSVTVHTPVVCYPEILDEDSNKNGISDRLESTQHIAMDSGREQLVIGETFDVRYPLTGQHNNIPGYGNRDYSSTTDKRQIQFSFDVYRDDVSGEYLRAGVWHDYVNGGEDLSTIEETFFIPNWAGEDGGGSVVFRTIPINSQNITNDNYDFNANDDVDEYKAVESIDVELSSRVYGFKVTEINDPNWKTYFKATSGDKSDNLPIMPGRNTTEGYSQVAVKLGYETRFSFETNGDMTGRDDVAVLTPGFYHVDSDGLNRQLVDVYYETKSGFVQYGSSEDTMSNEMVLNRSGRGMASDEISNTAEVLVSQNRGNGYDMQKYESALSGQYAYDIRLDDRILLTEMQKTYVGSMNSAAGGVSSSGAPITGTGGGSMGQPSSISDETVMESVQKWYGEFYLPSQTVVVPAGTDLSSYDTLKKGSVPFLRDGYIVVNFRVDLYHNISTSGDIDVMDPYLTYDNSINGRGNGWESEGYSTSQNGQALAYGDVIFYHVDKRASDDYE